MFNYNNLNDVEFEELCKDIMERKLNVGLRVFRKGRDRGVDLTDSPITHNIVIQVKHYINSKFSDLRTTLKKEVKKVSELAPNDYYICCGMELTDSNVLEIYSMFDQYMESDKNIISLKEIDDFLVKPENIDIVRKNYKLWLYSSNVLSLIYNNDVFIDCEALLNDIEEDCKFFVRTSSYDKCLEYLEKNRIVMMIGAPGVGKTVTSKMLVLHFASENYRVRYTTNGDISNIKRSLSADSSAKEVVLLDDCLGQHYFNMKYTQENELLSLVKYIKLNKNKLLILNSRITIFNEAKERSEEFNMFMQGNKINIHTINMDLIGTLEKAKIFYNHLYFRDIPREYFQNIKKEKYYMKIVHHCNYMPRIIDYVTNSIRYSTVSSENYGEYILSVLSHPDDIWKNEFERRLEEKDRAFMSTLYSLTDTAVDEAILKKCYNNRLKQMDVDYTVDNYEFVLNRLNNSIISIFDNKGEKQIGAINPSINDYMKSSLAKNTLEMESIKNAILHFIQLKRCYPDDEFEKKINQLLIDGEILNIEFNNDCEKRYFIVSKLCSYGITNELYKKTVNQYLVDEDVKSHNKNYLPKDTILLYLSQEPLFSFYKISEFFSDSTNLERMLENINLEKAIDLINISYDIMQEIKPEKKEFDNFILLCTNKIKEYTKRYIDLIEISEYCENYDIRRLIKENSREYYYNYEEYEISFDDESIAKTIKEWIEVDVIDELVELTYDLPNEIKDKLSIDKTDVNVNNSEINSIIESYYEPPEYDYDDDYSSRSENNMDTFNAIDVIFDRDFN